MAIRSSQGTGVVVSLVVFILMTVFLLVLSILFYAQKNREMESRIDADDTLEQYIEKNERQSEVFSNIAAMAAQNRQSVAGYLNSRHETLMTWVDGSPTTTLESVQSAMVGINIDEAGSVRNAVLTMSRDLAARQREINALNLSVLELNDQLADAQGRAAIERQNGENRVQAIQAELAAYRQAGEEYSSEVFDTVSQLELAQDRLRNRYTGEIAGLQDENDALYQDVMTLRSRVEEFQRLFDQSRLKPKDPAALVDGRVIETAGTVDEVYIDLGRVDRIALGMTFEVYDDAAQVRPNEESGEYPRGKASLQVIKVGETTSMAKVTRTTTGHPVLRGDVLANAVYDPDHHLKFLVHGQYDMDRDGRASSNEAEYLKGQIRQWGGEVVDGDEIPGDLDFLVLGVQPGNPMEPRSEAGERAMWKYGEQKRAYQQYMDLLDAARQAQIPVLNANRLYILTGSTGR
jgi:hypothetical protein